MAAYDQVTVENAEMVRQLSELRSAYDNQKILLQEKLADLNKSNKALHEAKAQHAEELVDVISQTKRSAALTVYQARIKMFEEASDPAFDKAKWDVDAWKKVVADLEGTDETETEKAGGSGVVKEMDDGAEGSKVQDAQDDEGEKDKA